LIQAGLATHRGSIAALCTEFIREATVRTMAAHKEASPAGNEAPATPVPDASSHPLLAQLCEMGFARAACLQVVGIPLSARARACVCVCVRVRACVRVCECRCV